MRNYYVYILTNRWNTVLYIGVTNDLTRRVFQHKKKLVDGFTKKYQVDKLVYYEIYDDPTNAINREKKLKGSSRARKLKLVNRSNAKWIDLYDQL